MARIGIFVSETWGDASSIDEIRSRARRAEALGYASGWVPYLPWSLDALASVQAAGEATQTIELGTAVIPTYLFHPLALARQAATTEAAIGRPLHLGIGCSNEAVISMHGLAYERPARHTREVTEIIDAALALGAAPTGEREAAGFIEYKGELFNLGSVYGTPGAKREGRLLVGALGPKMLDATGRYSDGTITTWCNALAIERAIAPALREAAAAGGRPAPQIASVIPTIVTHNVDGARAFAQECFGIYESLPRYKRMMELGKAESVADVCLIGPPDAIAERVAGLEAAGMTDLLAAPLAFEDTSWESTAEQLADVLRTG